MGCVRWSTRPDARKVNLDSQDGLNRFAEIQKRVRGALLRKRKEEHTKRKIRRPSLHHIFAWFEKKGSFGQTSLVRCGYESGSCLHSSRRKGKRAARSGANVVGWSAYDSSKTWAQSDVASTVLKSGRPAKVKRRRTTTPDEAQTRRRLLKRGNTR